MTKKVDFGMRCTRCGHKISDRVLGGKNGSRIEASGVCQKCHDEYNGNIGLVLQPGVHQYEMLFEELRRLGNTPTLKIIEGE